MDKNRLIDILSKYTKLMFIKDTNIEEFENLDGFSNDLMLLRTNIDNELNNIININAKFDNYGSFADALLSNCIYIHEIILDTYENELFIYKTSYFDSLLKRNDIEFVRCTTLLNKNISKTLENKILEQFNNYEGNNIEDINLYIKYMLTNCSAEEKINNIKLISIKFGDKLNHLNIDGDFLYKVIINTSKLDIFYLKLKNAILDTFNNENTLKIIYSKLEEFESFKIPF